MMKILTVKLTNFARIYSGMNKTTLDIDLTKTVREINLFVGDNGSGKTSTMRCLHPFAFNNSIGDSASNSKLIIDGMNGKKEITIECNGDIYYIVHNYTRMKNGTLNVKSFIEKNNTELNESGTSTTFKSIVEDELGITETYLTLLSISDSVDGFVEYTSSNRKTYATKLFSDLGIYNSYYKALLNLSKGKKALLANVTSKLDKYKGITLDDVKHKITDINKVIKANNDKKTSLNQSIGGIYNQLSSYEKLIKVVGEYESNLNELMEKSMYLSGKISTKFSSNELTNQINKSLDEVNEINNIVSELSGNVRGLIDLKESKVQSISTLKETLNGLTVGNNISELHRLKADLTHQLSNLNNLPVLDLKLSKDELIHASIYLDELTSICNRFAFEVEDESVIKIIYEKYKKNRSITKQLTDKFNEVGNQIRNFTFINLSRLINDGISKTMDEPCERPGCFYKTFYENYIKIINQSQSETEMEINRLKGDLSSIDNCIKISTILDSIFKYIESNKKYFKLPKDIFDINTFLNSYFENRCVYNKELMTKCIDILEQQDSKDKLLIQLDSVNKQLENYNRNSSLKESISSQIENTNSELRDIESKINKVLSIIKEKESVLETMNTKIAEMTSNLNLIKELDIVKSDISDVKDYLREQDENIKKIQSLKELLGQYQTQLNVINNELVSLESKKQQLITIQTDMETLQRDEITLREEYDEILEIRNAVSPTTGIPVEFIDYYVKEIMIDKINILLDSVYHGSFILLGGDNVIINENEFTLPYKKGSTIIQDISHASDGERAILSIAFSLVLIELSLDKYNIMLLDEIDSKLDHRLRGKFINMIEKYMEVIDAEQIFVISHNNMFDSYPVNILTTSENNMYQNTGNMIIKLYE